MRPVAQTFIFALSFYLKRAALERDNDDMKFTEGGEAGFKNVGSDGWGRIGAD